MDMRLAGFQASTAASPSMRQAADGRRSPASTPARAMRGRRMSGGGRPSTARRLLQQSNPDRRRSHRRHDPRALSKRHRGELIHRSGSADLHPDGVGQPGGDLYTSEWIKFQPDLASQLSPGQNADGTWGNWRALFEWKTGGQGANYGGDYRVKVSVNMDNSGHLYWSSAGDNNANGPYPFQTFRQSDNHTVPVIAGQWFHLETFTHRSTGSDGEFWASSTITARTSAWPVTRSTASCCRRSTLAAIYQPINGWTTWKYGAPPHDPDHRAGGKVVIGYPSK
jgi:hypothetical protein